MNEVFDARKDRGDNTRYTRKSAIRAFCTECMGGQPGLVPDCTDLTCPLYYFRMAHDERPGRVGRAVATPTISRRRVAQAARTGRTGRIGSPKPEVGSQD